MADEATPASGGLFKDENVGDGVLTALDDTTYRRLLTAKAAVLNRETSELTLAYHVISTLINKVPSTFELRDSDSGVGLDTNRVDLLVSNGAIPNHELSLILYATRYFVPTGITFTITQV